MKYRIETNVPAKISIFGATTNGPSESPKIANAYCTCDTIKTDAGNIVRLECDKFDEEIMVVEAKSYGCYDYTRVFTNISDPFILFIHMVEDHLLLVDEIAETKQKGKPLEVGDKNFMKELKAL